MKSARIAGVAWLACALLACDMDAGRPAVGKANSIIVATADSVWASVEDTVVAHLEPRVFTVRDERTFELTHVNPLTQGWGDLRRFRQVLVIGTPSDRWIAPVLDGEPPAELPAIVERENVWARNQIVTAIVLAPGAEAGTLYEVLPKVAAQLQARYREYARTRMFSSGVHVALQDTLARTQGFSVLLPGAYTYQRLDSTWVFRNHTELSGVLRRTVLVTWRQGMATQPGVSSTVAWRDSIGDLAYDPAQDVQSERYETRALELPTAPGFEVQGVWQSADTSWPAAGPFISRIVPCPEQNRTYLLDGWVYAPGPSRSKYEYLIQLNTIMDSFRCGRAALDATRTASP